MKHAKKMVLVDINTHKSQTPATTTNNETVDNLTKAISSLAASSVYSRDYFGTNAESITQLEKDMSKILEQKDIDPDTKLKLYHDKLKRYLFLQRESEREPAVKKVKQTLPSIPNVAEVERDGGLERDLSSPLHTPSSQPIQLPSSAPPVVQEERKSRYKSNIPRRTPKEDILRQRHNQRYDLFFRKWATPRKRSNDTRSQEGSSNR